MELISQAKARSKKYFFAANTVNGIIFQGYVAFDNALLKSDAVDFRVYMEVRSQFLSAFLFIAWGEPNYFIMSQIKNSDVYFIAGTTDAYAQVLLDLDAKWLCDGGWHSLEFQ